MKKMLGLIMMLSMFVAASTAFAGHEGHESHTDHGPSQGPADAHNVNESEILLNNCAQYVERIQQHVWRLQAQTKEKRVGTSVYDEIKKLEESLKEANDNARSLQIM